MGRAPDPQRGLTRRVLLGGLALLPGLGLLLNRRARASGPARLVVVWNNGGWDPTYVFDPHFGSSVIAGDSTATLGTAGGVSFADSARRPSVRGFFERYGARSVVVNGVSVGSISHDGSTRLVLTGQRGQAPDLLAQVAQGVGSSLAMPYVALSGPRFPGALGQVLVPLNNTLGGVLRGESPAESATDPEVEAEILAWLREEVDPETAGEKSLRADEALDRWASLLPSAGALELPEPVTASALLALGTELLSGGLCAALSMQVPTPVLSQWDSHSHNDLNQSAAFENLFAVLTALAQGLEAAPGSGGGSLLDETTVLVLSEMGRTPVLNRVQGKDHWPTTSALVFGAGVAGGQVVGATDEALVAAPVDPGTGEASDSGVRTTCAGLLAAVLQGFGLDPAEQYPDAQPLTAILSDP